MRFTHSLRRPEAWLVRVIDRIAASCGYVPSVLLEALRSQTTTVEQALRHKNNALEHQLLLRKTMQEEIEFLRQLELTRAKCGPLTDGAINRLHAVADNLERMLETFPESHLQDMLPTGKETTPAALAR